MTNEYFTRYEERLLNVGEKTGNSTVIADLGIVEHPNGRRYRHYKMLCDCGREFEISTAAVIASRRRHMCKYCAKQKMLARHSQLASKNPRLFSIWRGMKWRCEQSVRGPSFIHYRGRGISICKEWSESFDAFCEWALSNGYKSCLTIDRIDVNGNYEPSNCRWADAKTQANNRRPIGSLKHILVEGVVMPVVEAADKYGVSPQLAFVRLKRGWPVEAVFEIGEFKRDK